MKCKYCGSDLIDGTNFCVKCGNRNDEESQPSDRQKKTRDRANNKPVVVTISIITVIVLIAVIALIILCLPPSKRKIGLDALEYANIDGAYTVSDIVVSKANQDNGFLADVHIEAVNKDNNDIDQIQLYINYTRNGLKYDKNLSGEVEASVYPNHNPTEKDVFPLPEILLEIKETSESSKSSAPEDGITIDIDYEHIVVSEKTAEVPITIGADYANANGESTITVQYTYEGDYVWSGENAVTVDLQPKTSIPEELIKDDIKNNTFLYNGFISEELDGSYMTSAATSVQYGDLCNKAEVKTEFSWQNDAVKLTGNLLLLYDYKDDRWVFSDGQIDTDSVNAEWSYGLDEELLVEQLPEIIANHCTENSDISNIEIVNVDPQGGKTIVTVNYNSVQKPFLFNNIIELDYNATVLQGYQVGEVREISSDYAGINGDFDEDVSVNYSTNLAGTTPSGMSQSGTATVHLHINENGEAYLSGKIGTIPLDNSGTIEYPTGTLTLTTCEKEVNVDYVLIFKCNADIFYKITPTLTYCDGKLSGNIYCKSVAVGVDDFSIDIQ